MTKNAIVHELFGQPPYIAKNCRIRNSLINNSTIDTKILVAY